MKMKKVGRPFGPQLGEKFIEDLRKYWPTMSAREISAITGYRLCSIYKWTKYYGLKHDEATMQRMYANKIENFKLGHSPEAYEKISKARRRHHRMEKFRVLSGLPQQTNYHINTVPRRTRFAINGLIRRRNYYRGDDAYTLYYDSQTLRCNYHCFTEEYYTRKYGIRFEPGEE